MELFQALGDEIESRRRLLTGQQFTDTEFDMLHSALVFHDGISDDQEKLDPMFLPSLQQALLEVYGGMDAIGERRIIHFFLNLKPERILILKPEAFKKMFNVLNGNDENIPLSQERLCFGGYSRYAGLTILRDLEDFQSDEQQRQSLYKVLLMEEVCHQLIFRADPEKISQIRQNTTRGITSIKQGISDKLSSKLHSRNLQNSYFGNPDEEIAKAMQVKLWSKILHLPEAWILVKFGDNPWFEGFVESAKRGQQRINEQGWQKILRGDLGPRYI